MHSRMYRQLRLLSGGLLFVDSRLLEGQAVPQTRLQVALLRPAARQPAAPVALAGAAQRAAAAAQAEAWEVPEALVVTGPAGLAVSSDGTLLFVAQQDSGSVAVLSMANKSTLATVQVGSRPVDVTMSRDGSSAYVANSGSNNVSVIRVADHVVLATISVGTGPEAIAFGRSH